MVKPKPNLLLRCEAFGRWWGHEDGALMNKVRGPREIAHPFHHVRIQGDVCSLAWLCWYLGLGLPAFRIVRNRYMPPSLGYFVIAVQKAKIFIKNICLLTETQQILLYNIADKIIILWDLWVLLSWSNHLPKGPSPKTITLGIRMSTYEIWRRQTFGS